MKMNHMFNNIHGISPAYLKEDISLVGKGGFKKPPNPLYKLPPLRQHPDKNPTPQQMPSDNTPP